jgi:hypothetical protein
VSGVARRAKAFVALLQEVSVTFVADARTVPR